MVLMRDEYGLYLESGPKRRKTMVHVPALLGCTANGPTTEAALEAAPAAIRDYLRFLADHGEMPDAAQDFSTRVTEHITEGEWLGNGSPYVTFATDLEPLTQDELETYSRWFQHLRRTLSTWAATQSEADLDAQPADGGRPGRAVLLHILGVPGAYLATSLSGVTGFNRLQTQAERGEIALADGLLQVAELTAATLARATAEERAAVVQRPKEIRTLRKAIRRVLEHDWEHLAELSRRPGGPPPN